MQERSAHLSDLASEDLWKLIYCHFIRNRQVVGWYPADASNIELQPYNQPDCSFENVAPVDILPYSPKYA